MKKLLFLLLAILMSGAALAAPPDKDLEPALANAAASYLDSLSMDVLAMLRIAADTPQAKKRDWVGIRPYLEEVERRAPGVYFYVLPDGNYYTLERNFTNLSLRNRGYFKSLFEGVPVKGYEVYSRSTGKKSAVMAAPVTVDGKVTGALGASIFLDELHARLNAQFALPKNYTWFVVNGKGLVILDSEEDFMFMNALTEGGDSLKEAILESLKGTSGTIRYDIGGNVRDAVYRKLPSMNWWMIVARKAEPGTRLPITLKTFVPKLQGSLDEIDERTRKLLSGTKADWDDMAETRKVLEAALKESRLIFEAVYVDEKGRMRCIEPADYVNFEGSDISSQAHVVSMMKHREPVFSSGFPAVEGFPAVVIAYPVYDRRNEFKGSLNILIRPELMLRSLLKEVKIPADYELLVMQTDGMIIYDEDRKEIG
ncbi:MAG TPA: cache domain-containing protein, partial [Burkholderiales bacterium]|nr:cache domain-containing protein [Burkholderiales bacterium]